MAELDETSLLPSRRIQRTDSPVIVAMQKMLRETTRDSSSSLFSLAQGIVFWQPPEKALQRAVARVTEPAMSAYCEDAGLPALRQALRDKISQENGLSTSEVMVTAGANQAFTNVVIALCDPEDRVVLFPPFYFNHRMALQMSGIADGNILSGARDPGTLLPDALWVESALAEGNVKMLVITNPCNPTGTLVPRSLLERISIACAKHGTWLILDNTYEYFIHDEGQHHAIEAPHVINIFSFSKAFGMMGWRVGYLAFVDRQQSGEQPWSLEAELLKVQDTIPICPPIMSQHVALGALEAGRSWLADTGKLDAVRQNRQRVRAALVTALGQDNVFGGAGSIYLFARLPVGLAGDTLDDRAVVKTLAHDHGIVVIPGSACGAPGFVRVAYANLEPAKCAQAAALLEQGLTTIFPRPASP